MEHVRRSYLEQVSQEDWEKTLIRVKKLVESMAGGIEKLERQITELLEVQQHLSEKVNRTSLNSWSPPSSDPPGFGEKSEKKKSGKKRGGQLGHVGKSRDLYPIEKCSESYDPSGSPVACGGKPSFSTGLTIIQ